ncbi:MAG: DUF2680 domain-containing protein [Lutisporaceae bacterium]
MTKLKKMVILGSTILAIGATSITAFAASPYTTPAEVVAALTGKTTESIIAERVETNKTYGTIANDAGKLDEFKVEVLEIKKDSLSQRVTDGSITQERADAIITAIEQNQVDCDGTGSARIGQGMGANFGGMNGQGNGQGRGQGRGMGLNNGQVAQ